MSIGEVIDMIRGTGGPMNGEVLLLDAITNPEVTHIDGFIAFNPDRLICFIAFNPDRLICNALSGSVIGDDRGGALGSKVVTTCCGASRLVTLVEVYRAVMPSLVLATSGLRRER